MKDELYFHARRRKEDTLPSHTLGFAKATEDVLLCTWAKPHAGLDSYSKKFGVRAVRNRLERMKGRDLSIARINLAEKPSKLKRIVPNCVASTLGYYATLAAKTFGMPLCTKIILRGKFADWDRFEKEELERVPTSIELKEITLSSLADKALLESILATKAS